MVQRYLKRQNIAYWLVEKKEGGTEKSTPIPLLFRFSLLLKEELSHRDYNFNPWCQGVKTAFWRQFSVSDDADFILPMRLKIGFQFQLSICPIVHCPPFEVTAPPLVITSVVFRVITDSLFVGKYYHIRTVFFISKSWYILQNAENNIHRKANELQSLIEVWKSH